ncbi:hypothetical protein R1sor_025068 [Riccia sorocarpa]|uniref:Reverse transcriptase domain-containing protein n=1 Tax=Riccia sorocarpa TaxID=122646 RepID=A0ABD3G7I4_9MARC
MEEDMIAMWNLNGLGTGEKLTAVRTWLNKQKNKIKIFAVHELKVGERTLEYHLRQLIQGATIIVDYSNSDRGGAALVLHPSIKVESQGVRGNGSFAWAKVKVGSKYFGVASVYGPHEPEEKSRLIEWMHSKADEDPWILLGDWNHVLLPEDSAGPTPLLRGRLLEEWCNMDQAWDLQDLYLAQDKIEALEDDSGVLQRDEEVISKMAENFYRNLYKQPVITSEDRRERKQVLDLLKKQASEEDNVTLSTVPSRKEVIEILNIMARDKAPGEDGLTIEVLWETWEWTEEACIKFLLHVWSQKRIGENNRMAIVRLLPKGEVRKHLRQWRPIFLLSLSYKIIGKILAERLKHVIPKLIDEDQTGFVSGRNIMDNVLSLKLCQDFCNTTGQSATFCKLDFEKAFDRVQHEFLWDTLARLNLSEDFSQLIKMLVGKGRAKVCINGKTNSITLERGVRQGCPISPLLFAISSQPLMSILREEEKQGRITGVQIPKGRPLLHKLFADDSGITIAANEQNFINLRATIERFERISGAQLNVSKSVILPMAMTRNVRWLDNTGCKILQEKKEMTYLGCKVGDGVNEAEHGKDMATKINRTGSCR